MSSSGSRTFTGPQRIGDLLELPELNPAPPADRIRKPDPVADRRRPAGRQAGAPGDRRTLPTFVTTPAGPGRVLEDYGALARIRLGDLPTGAPRGVWTERTFPVRRLSPYHGGNDR